MKGIQFCTNEGLISTKLGTKHPWVKVIQVCSNEVPNPFRRGDNYEIAKPEYPNHWANFNQTWHKASMSEGDCFEMVSQARGGAHGPLVYN